MYGNIGNDTLQYDGNTIGAQIRGNNGADYISVIDRGTDQSDVPEVSRTSLRRMCPIAEHLLRKAGVVSSNLTFGFSPTYCTRHCISPNSRRTGLLVISTTTSAGRMITRRPLATCQVT